MNATSKNFPAPDLFETELDREIEESLKDPEYRAAFEDSIHRDYVIDTLVSMRKARGLTQKEIARRMGVGQPTISGLENEGSDPRLSTVQRYARAVEARCVVTIQTAIECDWVKPEPAYRTTSTSGHTTRADLSSPSERALGWAANAKRSSFAMAA